MKTILFLGPNTPGRFIVWFRNETTLLVLWQPPYPAGIYSNYKVEFIFKFKYNGKSLNKLLF